MKVTYIGELIRTPDAADHKGIRQGLEWITKEHQIIDPILEGHNVYIPKVLEFNPDIIVHGNTDTLHENIMKRLKEGGAKQVFWMLDYQPLDVKPLYHGLWDAWRKCGKYLDALFLSNYDQIPVWKKGFNTNVHFLPHGCYVGELKKDPRFHYPCVFIGSGAGYGGWMGERSAVMNEIREKYEIVSGSSVEGRNEVWRNMPLIYHTSDTVLDISHEWKVRGYASGRYFYTAGYGACSISKRFPGCEDFYKHRVHKAYWESPDEADYLIRYYQKNEKEREEMKLAAWEHNKKEHNYKKRFNQMFSKL